MINRLFIISLISVFSFNGLTQLDSCDFGVPPITYNQFQLYDSFDSNVMANHIDPNIFILCGDSAIHMLCNPCHVLGIDTVLNNPNAPFKYNLFFSAPTLSTKLSLGGGHSANFIFSTEGTNVMISSNYMCSGQIVEDTIFLGYDTIAGVGSGIFSIEFDCPVFSFSISGHGDGGGTLFQICQNSLTTPNLWGRISGDSLISSSQDSIVFNAFGGVAPYTFSYTVNGGAVQTLVSNTPQAWLPAPASNGTYTYELLQVKDGNDSIAVIACNSTYVAVVSLASTAELGFETVNFSLSPNPAKEELYISESIYFKENTAVQLTDMEGRIVLETKYKQGEAFDISGLKSGLYFLRIESEKGWVAKRFVKL